MPKKTKKGKERLDKFYQLAKDQGYRARSAFKLIQLAKKNDFLSKATVCLDLCAAPGGWSQVAAKNMPVNSTIIAIDLCPIKPMRGVTCIQSDITTDKCRSLLKKELHGQRADVVMHDGAPNVGSSWSKDAYAQNELTLHSMKLACEHLRPGGTFVTKVFRSADYNSLLWVFQQLFNKVEATKPTASRNVSAEIFVMCLGFKAGKIDPRFYDPKWVFMESVGPIDGSKAGSGGAKLSLAEYLKKPNKRHRGGYEEGDDHKVCSATDFLAAENPAEKLVTHHKISLIAPGCESILENPLTTGNIKELCSDLKILGKQDLSLLLKWRLKLLREREKQEREARKAEEKRVEEEAAAQKKLAKRAKSAAASGGGADEAAVKTGVAPQSLDDTIAELLDEDAAAAAKQASAAGGHEDDESQSEDQDEKLEEELAEQVEKRRREEKRDGKRTMARQRKQEMRKKMALGTNKQTFDEPDLFEVSKKNVKALEDQDKYIDPATLMNSDGESTQEGGVDESESDSDDELDRTLKLEVDIAVDKQLRQLRYEDQKRNFAQRKLKMKKENRRQRVLAAWAGEMQEFNAALDQKAAEQYALRNKDSDSEDDDDEDDDADVDRLQKLRDLQNDQAAGAVTSIDGMALEALVDGRNSDDEAGSDVEDRRAAAAREPTKKAAAESSSALVPVKDEQAKKDDLRAEHRVARWFSQDIFQNAGVSKKPQAIIPMDRESDAESDADEGKMIEFTDAELPKMPLTDKERRKLKRKREEERKQGKSNKKSKHDLEEEDNAPMEVAPLEPPRPIVPTEEERTGKKPSGPQKPSNPQDLAETLALGSVLTHSKKARMDIIDASYNRYAFEKDPMLPDWFTEEEEKCSKPELPVTKELMAEYRAKLREINARPIRKVTEAKARKKRRLQKRLEKLRTKAMSLLDTPDMSELAKARQMRSEVNKLAKQDERKVSVVAIKKGGGGKTMKGKIPKGAKVKVVDKRMKSDLRGQKKAAKRNKTKNKAGARKQSLKKQNKAGKRSGAKGKK